jgi:hypothetical protein
VDEKDEPNSASKAKDVSRTMLVTRMEEWCVEAETAEEARQLLEAGDGHRCHVGDCVQVELRNLLD